MDPTAGYIGANCSYCDQRFDIEALDHEDHCPACREAVAAIRAADAAEAMDYPTPAPIQHFPDRPLARRNFPIYKGGVAHIIGETAWIESRDEARARLAHTLSLLAMAEDGHPLQAPNLSGHTLNAWDLALALAHPYNA